MSRVSCHVLQGCLLGIKYDKKWGTVCDEGFNDNSAKVVCKSLGFEEGGVAANRVAVGMGIYIYMNIYINIRATRPVHGLKSAYG